MKVYLIFGRGLIVSGPLNRFREYLTVLGGHQHSTTVEPTFSSKLQHTFTVKSIFPYLMLQHIDSNVVFTH